MEFLVILALMLLVVFVLSGPLRRAAAGVGEGAGDGGLGGLSDVSAEREALEAAREDKLREIREADLDHRTGKLSDADFAALDAELRAEAAGILRALDALAVGETDGSSSAPA